MTEDTYTFADMWKDTTVVFTGNLKDMSREEVVQKVVRLGATVAEEVTADTTALVIGTDNVSPKKFTAALQSNTVNIWREPWFLHALQKGESA